MVTHVRMYRCGCIHMHTFTTWACARADDDENPTGLAVSSDGFGFSSVGNLVSVKTVMGGKKRRRAPRGSRRAKARRLLCLRAGPLPRRRTPLHLCRANRTSAVSSHTAVTPSPLTSPKHKFITDELQLSFLSVSHTLTMFLSLSCGWAPLRAAHTPLVCLFLSRGATHSASPARARLCLAFALIKRETRGSP